MTQGQIGQYLGLKELTENIPEIKVTVDDLGTTDTYHEEKILKKYLSLDKRGQELVYKAAIQMAIVGYGNKNYGFIRIDDKTVMPLEEIFKKYNIKYMEKINEKYTDDELSARRILRLFRYQIQEFIVRTNKPSYLWLKYSNKDIKYINICFPNGEHLVETKEQALYLLNTYYTLDINLNTKFVERLKRVYIARRIFNPLEIQGIINELTKKGTQPITNKNV